MKRNSPVEIIPLTCHIGNGTDNLILLSRFETAGPNLIVFMRDEALAVYASLATAFHGFAAWSCWGLKNIALI